MNKFTKFLVLLTAGGLLLTACGGKASTANPDDKANATVSTFSNKQGTPMVITPGFKPGQVNLKVGDSFEVQIPTIPTTGFIWQPKDLDTTILFQEGEAVYVADTSPDSAGGIFTLRFRAIATGKTTLHLIYAQTSGSKFYKSSQSFMIDVK